MRNKYCYDNQINEHQMDEHARRVREMSHKLQLENLEEKDHL